MLIRLDGRGIAQRVVLVVHGLDIHIGVLIIDVNEIGKGCSLLMLNHREARVQ